MSTVAFLQDLILRHWRFWIESGRLKFRAPENEVTDERLAELREQKQEIIDILTSSPESLDVCPLSAGQRALWFIWALSPQSIAYNQSLPIRMGSGTKADDWLEACRLLIERHPMLRTTFPKRHDEPIQQVHPTCDLNWATLDASAWNAERLAREIDTAHSESFDLEQGPLARFRWFTDFAGHDILLMTMHHIICDGWSLEIIRRELPQLHRAVTGNGPELPPLTYSYRDYTSWQHEFLNGSTGQRLWEYWRNQLSSPLPDCTLATDHTRAAVQTFRGDYCVFYLSEGLAQQLRDFSRSESTTLYVTLLTSLFVLLYRHTGQDDLLVGTPHSGRSRAEFAQIIGYFVNPIVIRARPSGDQSFREFLRQTRQTTLQSLQHSDYPFPMIVEKLRPERHLGHSPVFDISFNFLNQRASNELTGAAHNGSLNGVVGRDIDVFEIPQASGKFDLTLTVTETASTLTVSFGYNKDLFEPVTMQRLGDDFTCLLESIVANPDQELSNIPLHGEAIEQVAPVKTGHSHTDPRAQRLIHELFEDQAARHPSRTAVIAADGRLSYAELNVRANALAHYLLENGVSGESETLVGISTERSVESAVAIIAVLKAGGAYVPLDVTHPRALLEHMISHTGIEIVLATPALEECLPADLVRVIHMDAVASRRSEYSRDNPKVDIRLSNLAYVMFTSGSTGTPKGIAIEHRSLVNYVVSILRDLEISELASFALVSTLGADLGNTMLFPSLCTGGCLHILPEESVVDSKVFADYLSVNSIDYLKIVPSHLAALTDPSDVRRSLPAKAVILGGEGSPSQWVEHLQTQAPDCKFFNHYGPTEATVGALTYQFECGRDVTASATLPLSTAIADSQIYLLDQHLQPVRSGIAGELYIGGACLARGYVNDPELTGKKFLPHPRAKESPEYQHAVLYRTGDMARELSNGDIEILGRQDRQVKVRGYRVELEQIESILGKSPSVRQCAVLSADDGPHTTHLVAYVVPDDQVLSDDDNHGRLRIVLLDHLSQWLPQPMVPGAFYMLDTMPLTANGKIDYAALKRLQAHSARTVSRHTARDLVELALSRIWCDLLELSDIGIREDFFQLGGHSLLAVRLSARIHTEFKVHMPLATLLTHRTIEELAEFLRASSGDPSQSVLVPIQERGSKTSLFCLPGAGGSVLYFYDLACALGLDQPVWGLQAIGLDAQSAIPTQIEEIASRYVYTIQQELQPHGPYYLAGHSLGGLIAFEMAKLFIERGEEVAFLGIIDNPAPDTDTDQRYLRWGHTDWLQHIATRIGKLYGARLELDSEEFFGMDHAQQTDRLVDLMLEAGILPSDVNRKQFGRFMDVYKANAIAGVTYRPVGHAIDVELTLFRAADADQELRQTSGKAKPALGWDLYSTQPVDVIEVPGTHITMMIKPHVNELACRLGESLDRARLRFRVTLSGS